MHYIYNIIVNISSSIHFFTFRSTFFFFRVGPAEIDR